LRDDVCSYADHILHLDVHADMPEGEGEGEVYRRLGAS